MSYTAMLNHPSIPLSHLGHPNTQPQQEEVEDDEDIVPETQPGTQTRPSKAVNTKQPNRKKAQPCTPAEEVALIRAFVDISEDNQVGNAQRSGEFYIKFFIMNIN